MSFQSTTKGKNMPSLREKKQNRNLNKNSEDTRVQLFSFEKACGTSEWSNKF